MNPERRAAVPRLIEGGTPGLDKVTAALHGQGMALDIPVCARRHDRHPLRLGAAAIDGMSVGSALVVSSIPSDPRAKSA